MTVTLRFGLMKAAGPQEVRFITPPRRKLTAADTGGYYVTTAQGPDLFKDAQQAVRYLLDYMTSEFNLSRAQAYCLCGAAVDLKINQIVDSPNFMVSAFLPLSIFAKPRPKPAPRRAAAKSKRKPARKAAPRRKSRR
jgi:acetamidase/formamidase